MSKVSEVRKDQALGVSVLGHITWDQADFIGIHGIHRDAEHRCWLNPIESLGYWGELRLSILGITMDFPE